MGASGNIWAEFTAWLPHVQLAHFLVVSAILFAFGLYGIVTRKNAILVLMGVELVLNAANINLVAFSHYLQSRTGQVFAIFVITVAAAEAAVALAIIILISRNRGTVYADEFTIMKG